MQHCCVKWSSPMLYLLKQIKDVNFKCRLFVLIIENIKVLAGFIINHGHGYYIQ